MSSSWDRARAAFGDAARWFADVTARVEPVTGVSGGPGGADARWGATALGEWTVRDLVGHTSRALLTVETYLGAPAGGVEVRSAAEYFHRVTSSLGDPAAVAQRGRDAGLALGQDPVGAVRSLVERVIRRVDAAGPDDLVASPVGGMSVAAYLPTRTFELTVHTCDLAAALGEPAAVPATAAAETAALLGVLAAAAGNAGLLLRAATGRTVLPPGFTVL